MECWLEDAVAANARQVSGSLHEYGYRHFVIRACAQNMCEFRRRENMRQVVPARFRAFDTNLFRALLTALWYSVM